MIATNGTATNCHGPTRVNLAHLRELRASGLSDEQIVAAGLYTETDPRLIADMLGWDSPATNLGATLVIPYGDGYNRLKPSKPRRSKKDGKLVKYEAPRGRPNRVYVPPRTRDLLSDPTVPLALIEGEKKALACDQEGQPCVALSGVWNAFLRREKDADDKPTGDRKLIPDMEAIAWNGRVVYIAFDSDAVRNKSVRAAERELARLLTERGATVYIVRLPDGPPGADGEPEKVGVDDYLVAHDMDTFRELLKAATPYTPDAETDPRPVVVVRPDEHECVDEVVVALAAADRTLYQRGGLLVEVVRDAGAVAEPRIAPVPMAQLRTRITRVARVAVPKQVKGEVKLEPGHPPRWLVEGVHAAAKWPGVRPLSLVTTAPVLRSDGSVVQVPGYDAATGAVYLPSIAYPKVPESPTWAQVEQARDALLEVVCDVPFAEPVHRAAWLAGLFTIPAKLAFDGPSPLNLVDANTRASGKGLVVDVSCLIADVSVAKRTYPNDPEEMRKVITACCVAGDRVIVLDNIDRPLGDAALDNALTSRQWKDRLLKHSRNVSAPLTAVWWATGNNVAVAADTSRRVLPIRIESPLERPEDRADFRHPDLLDWVRAERGRLLVAVLTVLSGYVKAGRPRQPLAPWGSYEAWSDLVRAAVVWCGLPDPRLACREFAARSDTDAAALGAVVEAWPEVDPSGEGLTAAKLLDLLDQRPGDVPRFPRMREALADFCPGPPGKLPTPSKLGYRLRQFVRRNVGGRCLDCRPGHGGVKVWVVRPADMPTIPTVVQGSCPESGGDGGHGGHVSDTPRVGSEVEHTHVCGVSESSPPSPPSPPQPSDAWEEGEL